MRIPALAPASKGLHYTRRLAVAVLAAAAFAASALVAAPAGAAGKSFIWKASKGSAAIYLVGSVHVLSQDYYPLNAVLEDAFKDSNLLVEEVDFGEMMNPISQMTLLQRGMLPPGQTLDNVATPQTLELVSKTAADLGPGIEPLKKFKPWMLAIALQGLELQKAGFNPELGLDKHFYDAAVAGAKAVQGLETVDYQISRFDEMTSEQQDHLLAETLKELDREEASVSKLADAWKNGDTATIEQVMLKDLKDDPAMYQRLLVDRNRNWLPKIEALFSRQGHAFVVVGAAHLVGPDGLLQMLRKKGYTVQQL
jgi:uncharacterized protein YbaP (TraB family)